MKNLYLKTEKRYKETQSKISSLQLFSYIGQNVGYTRYKKRNLKNIAIGGPFVKIDIKNNKSNSNSKNKSFEDMIKIAIENEKFIKLLPVGAPTKSDYRVSSGFGYRSDPWIKASAFHNGIDIVADKDEILSTIDGEVTFAGEMSGYGNLIEIKKKIDEDEICIRFGHAKKILVKTGDIVKKGQVVGMQGNEGRSTSKHIHYEAKYNDTYLNPKNLILLTKL
jgi:murein DD-endopeptidase MepM/ murein hydrolase activator NlpD